jgi:hypothetical protein
MDRSARAEHWVQSESPTRSKRQARCVYASNERETSTRVARADVGLIPADGMPVS